MWTSRSLSHFAGGIGALPSASRDQQTSASVMQDLAGVSLANATPMGSGRLRVRSETMLSVDSGRITSSSFGICNGSVETSWLSEAVVVCEEVRSGAGMVSVDVGGTTSASAMGISATGGGRAPESLVASAEGGEMAMASAGICDPSVVVVSWLTESIAIGVTVVGVVGVDIVVGISSELAGGL